jgi:peptidyl-prolyl cis-trans isomerase B (cyclophilin B)
MGAAAFLLLVVLGAAGTDAAAGQTSKGPILVLTTAKGTVEIQTYPEDAPKTVERITGLANKKFYTGIRVHRVVPGFVVQMGDPQSRDLAKKARWGTGGIGTPIGVAEITKNRTHVKGAVAMAHAGDPAKADSQFYITLGPQHGLNGKYTVFGQVISGEDVVAKLEVGDVVKTITVK